VLRRAFYLDDLKHLEGYWQLFLLKFVKY